MAAPDYRTTLVSYLGPLRVRVAALLAVLLAAIGLDLYVPTVLQQFIDQSLAGVASGLLVGAGVAYLIAGVSNQLFSAIATYLGADIGWRATNHLRADLAEHLLGLDMGYHNETTPGEMIERVDGDVTAISEFIARFVVRLAGSGLLVVGVIIVCWFQEWRMGLAVTLYVAVALAVLLGLRNLAVSASEEERETSAALYGFIEERLAGIDDIRANGAGPFTMYRFVDVMRDWYFRTTRAWRRRTIFWVASNTAFWSGGIMALAVGTWLNVSGVVSVGTAYLLYQYVLIIQTPLEQVAQEFQELQKAAGGISRIDALRKLRSALTWESTGELPAGPLAVEFDHVSFAYETAPVLDDVSFELRPGTVLGLLGRTGSGKTTITRLLSRLHDPTSGTVRVGGLDVSRVTARSLRRRIGMVTQDVQLFQAPVRDNLTFFDSTCTDEAIFDALDPAGLGDWVRSIGLDTELGAEGQGLSAGESQLLAFARVFLQDPGVVVLDEPSSRLDPATEELIGTATTRLFSGRTVIIVAHRLETVRLVDEIIVLDSGRVVEHGRREDLSADPSSRYAGLLAAGAGSELA